MFKKHNFQFNRFEQFSTRNNILKGKSNVGYCQNGIVSPDGDFPKWGYFIYLCWGNIF